MRRFVLIAAASAALAVTAGAAQADVTDVIAAPSVAGALTVTGLGLGTLTAPTTTVNQSIGSTSGSIAGAQLTVTDATGASAGWDVTATYSSIDTSLLTALPTGVLAAADIGAANVSVSGATTSVLATANGLAGVAAPVMQTDAPLTSPVRVSRSSGDGRGVTIFNTSYKITLPAKSTAAATLYTGKIVYTVAPPVV